MADDEDRWVRVMPDHCSSGLWWKDGCMMDPEDLPISGALRERLATWADGYSACIDHLPDGSPVPFDETAYAAEGLAIAQAIKAELPGWTVIYFDISKLDDSQEDQPRGEFEYEVTPP
ncbi:hypothetical protein [Rhodovastum atsumiense]|nr:hypothetical protein [Rhodovastum atsumiense]